MADIIRKKAYAKINLGLDVCGRLPNGYHEVRMIMQTVDIYDELTLERIPSGIELSTDNGELSNGEDNLIYKAARAILDKYKISGGVRIHLNKNIPIAAGMAGGSTDAAATLKGVNELYNINAGSEELRELGVKLGADIPYCIIGGTALAWGIGEKLKRLKPAPKCYLVVIKPDINVSTQYVYEHLDNQKNIEHPDIDSQLRAIEEESLTGLCAKMGNVLEDVTVKEYPIIDRLKTSLVELGAMGSLMSGSGPTVFGIFDNKEKAKAAYNSIKEQTKLRQVFLTGFIGEVE